MVDIVNIVAVGYLGREYDLNKVSKDIDLPYVQYNPKKFPGLQVRLCSDGPVMSIFSSGKYTITGVTTKEEMKSIFDNVKAAIEDLGIKLGKEVREPEIRNLVCKADLKREVDLPTLTIALGTEATEYEPEQSAFVYYWPEKFDCLITIPSNGEVVITGIQEIEEAERAFNYLQMQIDSIFSG